MYLEAYFDESLNDGDHGRDPFIGIGGYVFTKENAQAFDADWKPLLDKYGLSHFSMADCNSQLGEFKGRTDPECVAIQTEFFEVLKRYASYGFAATMPLSLSHLLPSAREQGIGKISPYSFLCFWAVRFGRAWSKIHGISGQFAYFFEQGYLKQPEFASIMGAMFSTEELRAAYHHAGHGYYDKKSVRQLQAADILAWQWRKGAMERARGNKKPRRDLLSLMSIDTQVMDLDEPSILEFLEIVRTERAKAEGASRSQSS